MKITNKSHFKMLIFGFAAGVFVVMAGWGIYKHFSPKTNTESAPYYDQSAFSLPKELEKSNNSATASVSSTIKLPIVMYHYIEYVKDEGDLIRKKLDITPRNFEAELQSLKDGDYTTFFVKDVPGLIKEKGTKPEKSVILTFDDGYEDFYTDALPILKKFQMKATIYIVNHFIGRKGYLNKSQIKEIIDSGLVEIGSHTLDHAYLKKSPYSFAQKEIVESKKELETEFGMKVETFAYPYGVFTKEIIEIVKEASFSAAVSVIPGVMQSEDNLFYLNRIRPGMLVSSNTAKILDGLKK